MAFIDPGAKWAYSSGVFREAANILLKAGPIPFGFEGPMGIIKIISISVWVLLCLYGAVVGFNLGLMLSGLGMCAVSLTWQFVFEVVVTALILFFVLGTIWPRLWWLPVVLFDISISLPILTKEPKRIVASLICVVVAILAGLLGSCFGRKLRARRKA